MWFGFQIFIYAFVVFIGGSAVAITPLTPIVPEILKVDNPSDEETRILHDGIHEEYEKKGWGLTLYRAIFAKVDGTTIGGVKYYVYLGSQQIEKLWVDKEYRGQGLASVILNRAEEEGKKEGARFAILATMQDEHVPFYEKHGYKIEFQREGYDKGLKYYHFKKDLKKALRR